MAGDRRRSVDQLPLPIDDERLPRRLPASLAPMRPSSGTAPFDDDAYFFEPWWPGARTFAFVESGRVRLRTEHLSDPLTAFPELEVIQRQLDGDGVVLDGTLLVLDDEGRPDAELLRRRLGQSEVAGGEGAYVASDLLWVDGLDITGAEFEARRARLGTILRDGDRCVASRGLHGEGVTLASAVASMGLDGVSARRFAARWHAGDAGEDWIRLPVTETPSPETRPLLVLLQRLPFDS